MEENAQEATRKERGKQHKYQLKYLKILLAYLEKILYLSGIFFARENERLTSIGVCSSESALRKQNINR